MVTANPTLVLGPLLRHVGPTSATIWVEVDSPSVVTVQAGDAQASTRSWGIHGHHYAIVVLDGLPQAVQTPYTVSLSAAGEPGAGAGAAQVQVWPPMEDWEFPPSTIRTAPVGTAVRLAFGSCRRSEPLDADGVRDVGPDALAAMSLRLAEGGQEWPDVLLMIGDQLYADEPSPQVLDRLHRSQRAAGERGEGAKDVRDEICTFEEYTWLYTESWSQPSVRWLLAGVPTCMLLDDHDLRDDWNTSLAWREDFKSLPWFADRVKGALGSYWVYQHLGNLDPETLTGDPLLKAIQEAPDDETRSRMLDDFATSADDDPDSARWSYVRDFGDGEHRVRLVAVDCRCSRRLDPGARAIVDDAEWDWLTSQILASDPVQHLVVASTLPALMMPGFSDVESWNEAVAAGRWGRWAMGWGEKARRATDLEHWPAFRASFDGLLALLRTVVDAPEPPASVLMLAGDVHCSYTATAQLAGAPHPETSVVQLVMSPFRNPLKPALRLANRIVDKAPVRMLLRALAASAGVPRPAASWEVDAGPWFDNGVMTVVLDGRSARLEIDHVRADRHDPAGSWQRRTTRRQLTPT